VRQDRTQVFVTAPVIAHNAFDIAPVDDFELDPEDPVEVCGLNGVYESLPVFKKRARDPRTIRCVVRRVPAVCVAWDGPMLRRSLFSTSNLD
jgi:hypothetical protein